jgi:hypothetical protein
MVTISSLVQRQQEGNVQPEIYRQGKKN